jgi:peptide/nickel transport system permease protein
MRHGSVLGLVARRLVALAATVVIVPTLFFTITTALDPGAPGGPPRDPVLSQVLDYMIRTFWHFDFGNAGPPSYDPMLQQLLGGLPTDVTLFVSGMALGVLLGVLGGSSCARHPRSKRARGLMGLSALTLSTPPYLFGFAVLVLFAPGTGYLLQLPFVSEISDYRLLYAEPAGWVRAMWVPCLCVALPIAAQVLRMTEAALRETFGEEFIRTARAKGITDRRVVARHALPLAAPPVMTLAGVNSVMLITNVALMESAFNLPGSFRDLQQAVDRGELAFLQALALECAVFVVLVTLCVDVAQMLLDPRVRT